MHGGINHQQRLADYSFWSHNSDYSTMNSYITLKTQK